MLPFRAYGVLISLTLGLAAALIFAADALSPRLWIAVLAAVSLVKARLILFDYLGLRGVEGWRSAFLAGLISLITLVYAVLAIG